MPARYRVVFSLLVPINISYFGMSFDWPEKFSTPVMHFLLRTPSLSLRSFLLDPFSLRPSLSSVESSFLGFLLKHPPPSPFNHKRHPPVESQGGEEGPRFRLVPSTEVMFLFDFYFCLVFCTRSWAYVRRKKTAVLIYVWFWLGR